MDNIIPKRPLWGLRGCRLLPLLLADFYSYIAAQPKAKLAKVFLPLTAASRQSATGPINVNQEFSSSILGYFFGLEPTN